MEHHLRRELRDANKALEQAERRWASLTAELDKPSVNLEGDGGIVGAEVLAAYNLVALLREHLDTLDKRGKFVASSL